VLYGLDDGAHTFEESLDMVRVAAAAGTTDLVATPHANLVYKFEPALIRERLEELQAAADGLLRLYSGCDFHLSFDNIQDALAHPQKYTLNHGRYLLVEFSDLLIFKNTPEIFERLQNEGMIPVITHPERNGLLRQREEELAAWVEKGALLQVTAQSLLGQFGSRARDFSRSLLDKGVVHFIASDGHDLERRPPKMDAAHAWLAKTYGEPMAEALCVSNPRAAVQNEPLPAPAWDSPPTARKWYQLWR